LIASGSAKKRFDKAVKLNPKGILTLTASGDGTDFKISGNDELVNQVIEKMATRGRHVTKSIK